MPTSSSTGRISAVLFSRWFLALELAGLVLVILGCMSLNLGGRTYECHHFEGQCEDGLYVQQGESHVKAGSEQDVYYPAPYAHPPNLELVDDSDDCEIVEQKEDHFRVRNSGIFRKCVKWKARGVRLSPPVTPCASPEPPVPPPAEHSGPSTETLPAPSRFP